MLDKMTNIDYRPQADNELIEALANLWFQVLVLAILAIGIPNLVGFDIALLEWPVFVGIPVVAWWFGRSYGRFNDFHDGPGLL